MHPCAMKITPKFLIYMPKSHPRVKTVFCWPKWSNLAIFPEWSRPFVALVEGLPGVQIRCKIARWKGLGVYFPTQVEFLNLELI